MAGVLEGIKAIDMGHVVAVPAAGATLADWGAEVIKIEPLDGELARGIGTRYRMVDEKVVPVDDSEVNWVFQYLNRNKRGLALNLRTDPGREVLARLIKKTDIFMTNYEANTLKTLKADYETLSRFNPGLIYALLTGYGTEGPDRDERGFDYSAGWARSGAMHMVGEPGSVPPPQRGGM
jgi:crotonobetainyl-CoA:carnitine CoA-transferase CaiB-like acyl-CoA transferase